MEMVIPWIVAAAVVVATLVTTMAWIKAIKKEWKLAATVHRRTEYNLQARQLFLEFLAAMPSTPPTFFGEPYKIDAGYVSGAYPTLTAQKGDLECLFKTELDENDCDLIRLVITFRRGSRGDKTIRNQVLNGPFLDNIILMHKVQNWTLCWFADKEATSKSWSEEGYSSDALGKLYRESPSEEETDDT